MTVRSATREHGPSRIGIAIATLVVAGAALVALARWDDWFVNFDGEAYMALATNLRRGAGFVFPDGAFATFRGPMYPSAIAGAWVFVDDTARNAIWMSRFILVANAVLIALIVSRLSHRWAAGLVAGVVVAVQPLILRSGALFFVPDGAMAFFVLAAVVVFVWTITPSLESKRLLAVGALLGLAFLAKQSGALGALIVLGVLASAPTGGVRRLVRLAPILGLGFAAPVGVWTLLSLAETGQPPVGVPVPEGLLGVLMIVLGVGLLAAWATWGRRRANSDAGAELSPWVSVAAAFAIAALGLVAFGATASVSAAELPRALGSALVARLYAGTPWAILLFPLAVAVVWGAARLTRVSAQVGALMTAVGCAGIVYAGLTGAGFRNGVLVVYGLAALLAFAAEDLWTMPGRTYLWRFLAAVSVALAVVVSAHASEGTNNRWTEKDLTAEGPAVQGAATWIDGVAENARIAGTPLYMSTIWRLSDPERLVGLVPLHTIGRTEWELGTRAFPNRVDWAGTVHDPAPLENPIGVSVSRIQLSAYQESAWLPYLEQQQPEYLVITGNARYSRSAFDGGLVLPYLEASPSARAVYRSTESQLPQWVVIYELTYPFEETATAPIVHGATDSDPEPIANGEVRLTSPEYHGMVVEVLNSPVG